MNHVTYGHRQSLRIQVNERREEGNYKNAFQQSVGMQELQESWL